MKRIYTLLLLSLCTIAAAFAQIEINEVNFPDPKFREFLLSQTWGKKGELTDAGIAKVKSITVDSQGISDLTGIGYFTALTELYCNNNQLTSLDVSELVNLKILYCTTNNLTSLNVSNCKNLDVLFCSNNQLSSLDLSKNSALTSFYGKNQAVSYTLEQIGDTYTSDRIVLNEPKFSFNDNYTQYPTNKTYGISYENTMITSVANTIKSTYFSVQTGHANSTYTVNGIMNFNYVDASVTIIAIINEENFPDENFRNYLLAQPYGKDGVLTNAGINKVTEITVHNKAISNLQGIEYFTNLMYLDCAWNTITSLDLSELSNLRELGCSHNQLSSLDVSNLKDLEVLYCDRNKLVTLDLTANTLLKDFAGSGQGESDARIVYTLSPYGSMFQCRGDFTNCEFDYNNPNSESAINYNNKVQQLTSNSSTKNFVTFRCNTGRSNFTLTGEIQFIYDINITGIEINETNFPDPQFREYLLKDAVGADGKLSDDDIAVTVMIDISDSQWNVSDITGIEYFTNLQILNCSNNSLTTLILPNGEQNELSVLHCDNNQLSYIDLSHNSQLDASRFSGAGQRVEYALHKASDNTYRCAVLLNNPIFNDAGIYYDAENGILISESSDISSVLFECETGLDGCKLSGTMYFTYDSDILPNYYKITFSGEKITITQRLIEEGNTIVCPANPIRAGYTFGGWFTEETFENEWNFEHDRVTAHTTLWAKWILQTETGVETIIALPAKPLAYYNLLGQKLSKAPEKGIFLVKYADGRVENVVKP
ncbi:MAG: InlB B-repeat-containing protein [Bacteroidales bacterium]|jgi:uncharacterized repeat protein (TIGR02543 family)|nr:InlB B-repeat-containing protein [Bacteroidales bacterium]